VIPGGGVKGLSRSLATLIIIVGVPLTMARAFGLDRLAPAAQLVGYMPYFGILFAIAILLGFVVRSFLLVSLAAVLVIANAVWLAPRFTGENILVPASAFVDASAPRLEVMTLDLNRGEADPGIVVNLVRAYNVDVLAVQELTGSAVQQLDAAGLSAELPYAAVRPAPGPSGTGIYSRFQITGRVPLAVTTTYPMTGAQIRVGATTVSVLSVLTESAGLSSVGDWERDLSAIRSWPAVGDRILMGNFNATVDHSQLRAILADGYSDADVQLGDGMVGTWPAGLFPPPIALDHVLISAGLKPLTATHPAIPGATHRAVLAQLGVTG
jgi:endonuclease/exonuclease/phosphatase family metal-dependent hydrolase